MLERARKSSRERRGGGGAHLLHCLAHVTQPHVDPRRADAHVRGLLHGVHQRVELRVEVHREGAVDDAAVDLRAEVHLHDVVVLQRGLVAAVGRVVRRHVVERAARGEAHAGLQPALLDEVARALLQRLAHVEELDARLGYPLHVLAHLGERFNAPGQ